VAEVSAPSPSKRRKRFGRVKARMKAEVSGPTPSRLYMRISLNRPSTRDPKVDTVTMTTLRKLLAIYFGCLNAGGGREVASPWLLYDKKSGVQATFLPATFIFGVPF